MRYERTFLTRILLSATLAWVILSICAFAAERQVDALEARHRGGQTFVTWSEVDPPEIAADADDAAVHRIADQTSRDGKVRYRIYRSSEKITSIEGMTPIGETGQLSCYNLDYYGANGTEGKPAIRYVVKDSEEPLPHGTAVYVHNPKIAGPKAESYYAVTVVVGDSEDRSISAANCLQAPVIETQGQGAPVLQRILKPDEFSYIKGPELHYYVRWEAPPNSSVENRPIDYLVAIPPDIQERPTPVGLHLHCWGGSLNGGYGWWYQYGRLGTTYMISSNQIPYDWWTGYHELYYSASERSRQAWADGVVRPYTTRRMLSFLDWAAKKYDLDLNRVFTAGSSMGGSGAPMFAIRHSRRIAWSIGWVGVHDPGNTPQFKGSYEQVYGGIDWGISFEDGTPVFNYYKDADYLMRNPQKDVGFITWSNGKNDGGIGWPQAIEFYRAMQQTRRPHIFVWGLNGHGQRAQMPAGGGERVMPIDIRLDRSLPAFTNCSLDDNPGTATKLATPRQLQVGRETRKDEFDGDPEGQVNLYLCWRPDDIVDTTDRWEITVDLTQDAPKDQCTVNITPRRLQEFRPVPGQTLRWSVMSDGRTVQSGKAIADKWGLVTLPSVVVSKKPCRIAIRR